MSREADSPIYLPPLDGLRMPAISEPSIETMAIVLAGFCPSVLEEKTSRPRTLSQLRLDPRTKRIGPSTALRRDHRYILHPIHACDDEQFEQLWMESKSVAGSQDSTELLKLVRWLKKLEVDDQGKGFAHPQMQKPAAAMIDFASRVQFYLFHSAVRRIDRESTKSQSVKKQDSSWAKLIARLTPKKPDAIHPIEFPIAVLDEAESYMISMLNLGRVLRSVKHLVSRKRA